MHIAKVFTLLPALATSQSLSVFGHIIPDTDATTSAVIYAWELNERNIPATPFRLGGLNPETTFVFETLGLEQPALLEGALKPSTPVAIVDTSNPEELPEGILRAQVHSIVDHHKLSGLTTSEPLEIDVRPLCSATSILYSRAKAANLTPTKQIAGLMLAGILSDSLEFRSPTTTATDKVHAEELAVLAGLDMHEFATKMLDAKANVDHLSAMELITMDSKIYELGAKRYRVSVLETTKPELPLAKQAEIVAALKELTEQEQVDDVIFFVVDILGEAATFISASDTAAKLVERAWGVEVDARGTASLPGVLSRKKQIVPKLEAAAMSVTSDDQSRWSE